MNNIDFKSMNNNEKEDKMTSMLYKRAKGLLSKRLANAVVKQLDLNKQIEVKVVNIDSIGDYCYKEQYTSLDRFGNLTYLQNNYCNCILGEIVFGERLFVSKDESKELVVIKEYYISEYPLIVLQNQDIVNASEEGISIKHCSLLVLCLKED